MYDGRLQPPRLLLLVCAGVIAGACARPTPVLTGRPQTPACAGVIDADERPSGQRVLWIAAEDVDPHVEAAWCATVGPVVVGPSPAAPMRPLALDDLVIVSWNTHVGGGDLPALVGALRSGALTGEPVADFVLLTQEAFRDGGSVPRDYAGDAPVPDAIRQAPPHGDRQDVVSAARALGLAVYYVPAVRNGEPDPGAPREDRGNAILSTRPLSAFTAIVLPSARQRRVAIAADVEGIQPSGEPWRLRVVSSHLEATADARSLWLFASDLRARQARALAVALDAPEPTVVGSDLNTWAGGPREPAYFELRRAFPDTPRRAPGPTFRAGLTLDYVFFRLSSTWEADSERVPDRFGSDHHPVIGRIRRTSVAWEMSNGNLQD
jgi:endonuclease/exonuclease/phosphatase family metal-dependent hydrolase